MARARLLVMFMTTARALSAQSSSLPLTTAATRTLLQALSPEIAAPHASSLLQARRNFAGYGAFAAVAGVGLYFVMASGENAAVPAAPSDDHFAESDTSPDAKKSASHVHGVLQVLFGHLFLDALGNYFAPKSEIQRLKSLLNKAYKNKKLKKQGKQAIVKDKSENPGLTDVVCVYEPSSEDDGVSLNSVENCEVKKDGSESGTAVLKQVRLVDGGFLDFVTFTRMGWYQNLMAVSLLNYIKNVHEVIKLTSIKDTKVTNIICTCEDNSRLVF